MIYGSVYDSLNESTLLNVAPYEFDESMSFQEMGAQMIEEATQDWNNYMQAIALTELSYVMETGEEYIYEGVDISAMVSKVKEWFKKLWAKIQGIAKAAIAKFASFGKNDEAFIEKYDSAIHDGADKLPAGFSYKGYKFDGLLNKSDIIKSVSDKAVQNARFGSFEKYAKDDKAYGGKPQGITEYSKKWFDGKLDSYRSQVLEKSGDTTSTEFKKALKVYLYGSADKEYIKTVDSSKLIEIVKGCKPAKEAAKEAESALKESIDAKIEEINDLESRIRSNANNKDIIAADDTQTRSNYNEWAAAANRYSKYLQDLENINAMWFTSYITALKDQNRQAKALCVKMISFANGIGGAKNESASLLEDRFNAIFE